jgi:hypothetical protein
MLGCFTDMAESERGDFVKSVLETMASSMHTGIRRLDSLFNAQLDRELAGWSSQ